MNLVWIGKTRRAFAKNTFRWYAIPLLLALQTAVSSAQVTLTGTSYSQDFDAIGSGLPSGWDTRISATASSLGTVQSFTTTATAWGDTSGRFGNVAAAESPATSADASGTQASRTDRALAVRQSGSFGDPGAAFNFYFNASGVTFSGVDPALSVKMQQFDNQGRAATWSIQYGIGASPASWTTLGTWDTVAGWNSANVTFTGTDLAALSGQAAAWIRVVALSASTGSGSRDRVGIDDFTLTYSTAASAPTVSSTAASGIGTTAATVGGNVTADGGASVTDRGVVYKTGSGVTISDNKTAASPATGTGSFSINLSSLSVNQQYYHRAYAINSSGTTLGTELSFHTLANTPSAPTVNNATVNSLDVTLNVNGNPAATTFAIEADTNNDSVYDGYVQANGSVSASAVWQTAATWGTRTVGGLSQGQTVAFRVKARNGANVETAFGGAASGTTASGCNAPTVNTPGISSSAVCAGESVTLTANTTGGTAPFNYQWKRNGSNVGANSATYEIASAAAGDAGSYTVTVTPQCGGAGVESASASLTVNALPTITLGSSPAVCRGTTSANLPYSATTGSPDQYSIDFNAAAESAGFSDVALTALGASPIAVTVPGGVAAGTYNATITVRRNSTGCAGTPVAFTITVHAPPTASVNSPSTCSGSSATMTATPSGGQGPYSYAWSVPPGASNPGNTASFSASVAGIYSVVVTDNRGCASDSAQGTLTVNSFAVPGPTTTLFSENMGTPSSTTAISANTFENASLTFTGTADVRSTSSSTGYTGASAGGNVFITTTVGTFFQIAGVNTVGYQNLALSFGIYKSTTAGTGADLVVEVSADGSSYTALSYTALPSGSGTAGWYYRTATGTIPATANLRIRFRQTGTATQYRIDDVQLTGSGSQVTTATVTPSSGAICSGNALRLTATTNGASYAWAVPAGASNPGNVSSFDASVAGTYTVTITDANGCTATAQATLTTATAPSLTLGGSPTVCQGATSASLPYSGATGSPDQYSIDFNAAAESAGFNDVVLASLGASPIAITVPGAAPAGAYTGTLTVRNSGQGCDSAGQSFTVTISGTPAQPGTITQANPAGTVVCTGAAGVTYTIAAVSGATSYNWTLPVGASITAGDGTTSITVNWGSAASGSVSVQAVNACASGTARTLSVSVTAGAPSAPTATAGSDVSPTAFTANWQPLAGATGYLLDVSETEDFSGAFVVQDQNIASGATVSYALSSLTSGATYFYRVRAYNACGNGPYSATVTVLTPLVLAGWDMSGLSNFGPSPMAASMSASGVTVGGLTRGSGVGIGGTAAARGWGGTNWNGASASAAEAAGQFATFTVAGNAGVSVSFNQVSRFDYRRSTTGPDTGVFQYALDGVNFVDIATVTYSSTASSGASVSGIPLDLSGIAALQDVAPGVTVTFRIVNHGGSSTAGTWYLFDVANSTANDFEIRGTLCATPTAYTVTGGGTVCAGGSGTAVGLSGSQAGVSYQLLRDATPVGSSVAGTGGAISFGLHTTAGAYTVEATRNSGGCDNTMNGSVAITVNTAPSAPTGLAATPGNGQVELNWNATGGATAYRVKRGTSSGGPFSTLAAGSSVAGTTFTDATAQNGNTYYYVVSALNGPCEGPNSSSVQASLAGPPPDAPVALTATAVTPTSFQANWNAASGATSYRFDVATENTFSSFVAGYQDLALGNVTLRAVSGLAPGQTYYFRVRAQNSSGISEDSNAITVTLPSSTTVAISGLAAVDANTGTINFGATANAYYDVYYSDSDLSGTTNWTLYSTVQASGSSMTVDVPEDDRRYFKVVVSGSNPNASPSPVWGVIKPSIPSGYSMYSAPLDLADLTLSGAFGDALKAGLADSSKLHILEANGSFTTITLSGGNWNQNYTLAEGQGFFIENVGAPYSPRFAGPVGVVGSATRSINPGAAPTSGRWNIIGPLQGKTRLFGQVFATGSFTGTPTANWNQNFSDVIAIDMGGGVFKRIFRAGDGTWRDASTLGVYNATLHPGTAVYYFRYGDASLSITF